MPSSRTSVCQFLILHKVRWQIRYQALAERFRFKRFHEASGESQAHVQVFGFIALLMTFA